MDVVAVHLCICSVCVEKVVVFGDLFLVWCCTFCALLGYSHKRALSVWTATCHLDYIMNGCICNVICVYGNRTSQLQQNRGSVAGRTK